MRCSKKRIQIATVAGLAVFLFITSANALVIPTETEFEDWGTTLSPYNPLTCSGLVCRPASIQSNISPHTHPAFEVNRTAVLNQASSGGKTANGETSEVVARTIPAASNTCSAMPGEGCLQFKQGNNSTGSLTLDYSFTSPDTNNPLAVQFEHDNFGILAKTFAGSDPFDIAGFYQDILGNWHFAGTDLIDETTPEFYIFRLPAGTMTSKIALVYNPLSDLETSGLVPADIPAGQFHGPTKSSIESELCCARADPVPEPSSLPVMGAALAVAGFALMRRKFRWGRG